MKASLHSVEFMTCTTDIWTSRASDAYISLTCHFIDQDFTMSYYNLECKHFPGAHDYANIMEMIKSMAMIGALTSNEKSHHLLLTVV